MSPISTTRPSPLASSSAPPFRGKEWRNLILATGAPGRRSRQRRYSADSLMPLDRDVIEAVRDMDEHELRRLLMLAAARLEKTGIQLPAENRPQVRYRSQFVRCGKSNCSSCPHGPYWYAHWREGGRRRSRYLGRLEDVGDNPRAHDHKELFE